MSPGNIDQLKIFGHLHLLNELTVAFLPGGPGECRHFCYHDKLPSLIGHSFYPKSQFAPSLGHHLIFQGDRFIACFVLPKNKSPTLLKIQSCGTIALERRGGGGEETQAAQALSTLPWHQGGRMELA